MEKMSQPGENGSSSNNSMSSRDRHAKVMTCKGPRDRRIRLSSETAAKFYDIHHRLGFEQPTQSVDWLLQQSSFAIRNLPELFHFQDYLHQSGEDSTAEVTAIHADDWVHVAVGFTMDDNNILCKHSHADAKPSGSRSAALTVAEISHQSSSSKSSRSSSTNRHERIYRARQRARERTMDKHGNANRGE